MIVAPLSGGKTSGPRSGFHSGRFIFAAKPSYSPSRMFSMSRRAFTRADSAKR